MAEIKHCYLMPMQPLCIGNYDIDIMSNYI